MPRLPVERVIEYRHTLGTKERMLLEEYVGATSFNKVATPVVAGMSDISFMIALGGILAIWFPEIVLPTGAAAEAGEVVDSIKEGVNAGLDRIQKEAEAAVDEGEDTLDSWWSRLIKYRKSGRFWRP